jgi:Tol biopolymer transport system component
MPLTAGTRLGPYEILLPLGAGGMGEVYKARDTRLDRTVAVKVLPAALAADPEFKARFEREAKSISALNHPHICTLHDVGESAGTSFLVMEFLEGETLADRLKRGPLPVAEALELAVQMAGALDKAHRQGIVHRDLKPANVFLVRGAPGTPACKLLDFGLAKVGVTPAGTIETRLMTSASPPRGTAQGTPLTAQGSILGTFQYMAPEQIEGLDADARTDIWGFGCVLYEMLTGRRAFEGRSQASLIASILERQPTPMAELQPMTPPALGRLVRTCLEKDPDNRFHTAHDLWLHLQWIEEGGSAAGLPAPVIAGRRRRDRAMFAGAAAGLAALAATAVWFLKPAPAATDVVIRFSYPLPEGQSFTRTGRRLVAISPDGSKIAYIANNQIYLRRLPDLEAQPIRGSDIDPLDLTFSPDGNAIAFFAPASPVGGGLEGITLKTIDVGGGKPLTLCSTGPPSGVRWLDDRIVFSLGDRIQVVASGGGTPETLVTAGQNERLARPQLFTNGTLLYTVRTGSDNQIVVQSAGGARRVLVQVGQDGYVLTGGYLTWMRESTLLAQAIDVSTLQLAGGPVPLVEGIRVAIGTGTGQMDVSDSGTLVFAPGVSNSRNDLVWVDRSGREEPTGAPPQSYTYPRISPEGTRVATQTSELDVDIWIWDLQRKTMTKLTSGPQIDQYPVWTPDGKSVIFRSGPTGGGQTDLYRRNADGTGGVEKLTDTPFAETAQLVTKDGLHILARRAASDSTPEGALVFGPLKPGATLEPVLGSSLPAHSNGELSPDGRWLAYQSREGSTTAEIHVRPFPATDSGHWQITSGGGVKPMWSHSGRELFYQTANPPGLMRVRVTTAPGGNAFTYTSPPETVLNVERYFTGLVGRAYDISLDDRRFLLVRASDTTAAERPSLTIVVHWLEEVRARVKAK